MAKNATKMKTICLIHEVRVTHNADIWRIELVDKVTGHAVEDFENKYFTGAIGMAFVYTNNKLRNTYKWMQ